MSKNTVDIDIYEDFKTWDLGDIVGVKGKLFKNKTNELTIEASAVSLITKSIRPRLINLKVLPILRQDIDKDILI